MRNGLKAQDMATIVAVLERYPAIEKAVLYGSRAMGTHKKFSDIDLALKGEHLGFSMCTAIHAELEEDTVLPYFFDVTHYATISNEKLREHIDRRGVVIYRKAHDA